MKQLLLTMLLAVSAGVAAGPRSYDAGAAARYAELFADAGGAGAGKAFHFVSPQAFVDRLANGEGYVAIDIRTPAETSLVALALEDSLSIPADRIFEPDNLERIPGDRPVMIICKSGARAAAVGTALRHIGFDNVYILKGGIQGLASYYGPAEAYAGAAAAGDEGQ